MDEKEIKENLQKLYVEYVTKKLIEASENELSCRISINVRQGHIESIQDVQTIAGVTITKYHLDNK